MPAHFRYAIAFAMLFLLSGRAVAQEADVAEITQMLKGPERVQIVKGVEAARQELLLRPKPTLSPMIAKWLPALVDRGMSREADALAQDALVQAALIGEAPAVLESLLEFRVRTLLALHEFPGAQSAARSLYNCAGLDRTAKAVETVGNAIAASNNGDEKLARRFRLEQLRGITTRPATPSTQPQSVIGSLRVDGKPYEDALERVEGNDFAALTKRGNLLLLANRGAEARRMFEDAYRVAPGRDLSAATENIARAMRAEDGNVARANAWVLSARPK